jgi:hypothetical protein
MSKHKILITSILMVVLLALVGYYTNANKIKVISKLPYNDGYVSLRDDGMVLIETSNGKDMLPVYLVSQELVDAFAKDIESKQ